jgi:hypothetical protein
LVLLALQLLRHSPSRVLQATAPYGVFYIFFLLAYSLYFARVCLRLRAVLLDPLHTGGGTSASGAGGGSAVAATGTFATASASSSSAVGGSPKAAFGASAAPAAAAVAGGSPLGRGRTVVLQSQHTNHGAGTGGNAAGGSGGAAGGAAGSGAGVNKTLLFARKMTRLAVGVVISTFLLVLGALLIGLLNW